MKLGLACLARRAPCMHLFMTMLAATASVATSSCLASPLLEQLPQTLRFALVAKHQELDAKAKDNPGGGNPGSTPCAKRLWKLRRAIEDDERFDELPPTLLGQSVPYFALW